MHMLADTGTREITMMGAAALPSATSHHTTLTATTDHIRFLQQDDGKEVISPASSGALAAFKTLAAASGPLAGPFPVPDAAGFQLPAAAKADLA